MRIQKFEDVISWQEGKELYFKITQTLAQSRDYSFRDQIFRATLSITNNIAEGFDRGSDKELRYFLYVSRGSCAEVRSMLHIALEAKYITTEQHTELVGITIKISKLLTGFINKLATDDKQPKTKNL